MKKWIISLICIVMVVIVGFTTKVVKQSSSYSSNTWWHEVEMDRGNVYQFKDGKIFLKGTKQKVVGTYTGDDTHIIVDRDQKYNDGSAYSFLTDYSQGDTVTSRKVKSLHGKIIEVDKNKLAIKWKTYYTNGNYAHDWYDTYTYTAVK